MGTAPLLGTGSLVGAPRQGQEMSPRAGSGKRSTRSTQSSTVGAGVRIAPSMILRWFCSPELADAARPRPNPRQLAEIVPRVGAGDGGRNRCIRLRPRLV